MDESRTLNAESNKTSALLFMHDMSIYTSSQDLPIYNYSCILGLCIELYHSDLESGFLRVRMRVRIACLICIPVCIDKLCWWTSSHAGQPQMQLWDVSFFVLNFAHWFPWRIQPLLMFPALSIRKTTRFVNAAYTEGLKASCLWQTRQLPFEGVAVTAMLPVFWFFSFWFFGF